MFQTRPGVQTPEAGFIEPATIVILLRSLMRLSAMKGDT
jgi:hypothetical protein